MCTVRTHILAQEDLKGSLIDTAYYVFMDKMKVGQLSRTNTEYGAMDSPLMTLIFLMRIYGVKATHMAQYAFDQNLKPGMGASNTMICMEAI